MTIRVEKFQLTKAQLAAIPADERALMFLSGHTLNMLGVWIKILRFSTNHEPENAIEGSMSAAQSHIILRSLYGVLAEAWEWLRRPESQRLIGLKYLPGMPTEATEAYDALNKSFGGSSLLHNLRNRFAYHHPSTADLDQAFDYMPEDENWSWYVTSEHTNTLYLSCEMVVAYGAIRLTGASDYNEGLGRILTESVRVANALNAFLASLLALVIKDNLGPSLHLSFKMDVADAPDGKTFALPFFAEGL